MQEEEEKVAEKEEEQQLVYNLGGGLRPWEVIPEERKASHNMLRKTILKVMLMLKYMVVRMLNFNF